MQTPSPCLKTVPTEQTAQAPSPWVHFLHVHCEGCSSQILTHPNLDVLQWSQSKVGQMVMISELAHRWPNWEKWGTIEPHSNAAIWQEYSKHSVLIVFIGQEE